MKAYREANRERISQRKKDEWARTAIAKRDDRRRRQYGVTPEDYDAMFAAQGGLCAICGFAMARPSIDHDHSSGAVRGILCQFCNIGLGNFRDDIARLSSAILYLQSRP